ncbi:hypothetical protein GCM10028775_21340 [Catellatospora paridis]
MHSKGNRGWWGLFAAVVALTVLGLSGLVWFLTGEGLARSDQWASAIGLPLAVLVAVIPLLVWIVRRARAEPAVQPSSSVTEPRAKFHVSAGRDAYTAEQMIINRNSANSAREESEQ